MEPKISSILSLFKEDQKILCLQRAKILHYVSIISNILFILTDYTLSEGHFKYFVYLRIGVILVCLVNLAVLFLFKKLAIKCANYAVIIMATVAAFSMIEMSRLTGGYDSLYSSGFAFIILASQTAASWYYMYQLVLSNIMIIIFMGQRFFPEFDSNSMSYMTYGWITIAAGVLSTINSYMQYQLRFQLKVKEQARIDNLAQLKVVNEELKNTQAELVRSGTLSAVGELAAGVAHNVNTYMSGADMGLTMVLDELKADNKLRQTTKTALESIRSTKAIVSSLEEFSQKNKEGHRDYNLHDGIMSVIRMFKLQPNSEEVQVHNDYQAPHLLNCNLQQIKSSLLNLFKNSLQSGSKNIWINTNYNNDCFFISVKDDGPGIPENIQNKIFEPFFTTKDVNQGTGLGLWMVYRTVKEHRGEINVISQPGQGAKFVMTFPKYD